MECKEALKTAAKNADMTLRSVSLAMGKSENLLASTLNRGSTPRVDTVAEALAVCGYALAAVPLASVPPDALVIDAPKDTD